MLLHIRLHSLYREVRTSLLSHFSCTWQWTALCHSKRLVRVEAKQTKARVEQQQKQQKQQQYQRHQPQERSSRRKLPSTNKKKTTNITLLPVHENKTIRRRNVQNTHTVVNDIHVISAEVSDKVISETITQLTKRGKAQTLSLPEQGQSSQEEKVQIANISNKIADTKRRSVIINENYSIHVENVADDNKHKVNDNSINSISINSNSSSNNNECDKNEIESAAVKTTIKNRKCHVTKRVLPSKLKNKAQKSQNYNLQKRNVTGNTRSINRSEEENEDKIAITALESQNFKETPETVISQVYLSFFRSSVINPFNGKLLNVTSANYKLLERLGFQRRTDNLFQLEWNEKKFQEQVQKFMSLLCTKRNKELSRANSCEHNNSVLGAETEEELREQAIQLLIRPLELAKSGAWKNELAAILHRRHLSDSLNDEILRRYSALTNAYFPAKLDASVDPAITSGLTASKLTIDQQNVVALALRGYHIYIGGSAGTGKTVLLKVIFRELTRLHLRVAMTATTGVAAVQLGGATFHHSFNVPLEIAANNILLDVSSKTSSSYNSSVSYKRRWDTNALRAVDVVIIDEVSLLDAEMIDAFDMEARLARMDHSPFGGIQVIACGDFLQLSNGSIMDALPAYMSDAFKHLILVKLTTPMRHREGDPLMQLLTDLRYGRFNESLFVSLDRPIPEETKQITYIFPRRREAQALNEMKLSELQTTEMMCVPQRGSLHLFGKFTPSAMIEWEYTCESEKECNSTTTSSDFSINGCIEAPTTTNNNNNNGNGNNNNNDEESCCDMNSTGSSNSHLRRLSQLRRKIPERATIVQVVQEELSRIAPNTGYIANHDIVVMPTRTIRPAILLRLRYPDGSLSVALKSTRNTNNISAEYQERNNNNNNDNDNDNYHNNNDSDNNKNETESSIAAYKEVRTKLNSSESITNNYDEPANAEERTEDNNELHTRTENVNLSDSRNISQENLGKSATFNTLGESITTTTTTNNNNCDNGNERITVMQRPVSCKSVSSLTSTQYEELVHCVAKRLNGRVKAIFNEEPQGLIPLSISMALADVTNSDIAATLMPLRLKLGCRVMVNRNLSRSVSNGSVGVVEAFAPADANLFPRRREVSYSNRFQYLANINLFDKLPVIRLLSGEVIQIPPVTVTIGGGAQTFFYGYEVHIIPLQLGYGFTVHKVQGLTLQGTVVLDCKSFFECPHLIYVACSRVRTIDQLIVRNITPEMVIVKKSALEFSNSLLDASNTAALSRPLEMVRAAWTKRIQPRIFLLAE